MDLPTSAPGRAPEGDMSTVTILQPSENVATLLDNYVKVKGKPGLINRKPCPENPRLRTPSEEQVL